MGLGGFRVLAPWCARCAGPTDLVRRAVEEVNKDSELVSVTQQFAVCQAAGCGFEWRVA